MMRLRFLVSMSALTALALVAFGVSSAVAAGPEITPWRPVESYAGRSQEDARLNQTVAFWGAGMPLKQVFASIEEQTGVHIGFFPPGDDNERICVNLYLNPDDPPTLRELMAQLSWVVDCSFGVEAGEAEQRYVLLSTSVKDTALQRIQAAWGELGEEWRQTWEQQSQELRQEVAAKLPEAREALGLSRRELIKRYQGKDDALLLALLEPKRRATLEFVLDLPPEDMEGMLNADAFGGLTRPWNEWSPSQQQALAALFEANQDQGGRRGGRSHEMPDWTSDPPYVVTVQIRGRGGRASIDVDARPEEAGAWAPGISAQSISLVGDVNRSPGDLADLREQLGNPMTEDEQNALRRKRGEEMRSEWEARRDEGVTDQLLQQIEKHEAVSQEMFEALSSFDLPYVLDHPVTLWQLQEVVARKTGRHVVSDCFWQPARSIRRRYELVYPDKPEVTGYVALGLAAAATEDEYSLWGAADDERAGWEWGDAGSFLRFRHVGRDLWRSGFIPEGVLSGIDGWLKPYAAPLLESGKESGSARVEIDPREASGIVRQLTSEQLRLGGQVLYGDPTSADEAFLHALREAVLGDIARSAWVFQFLVTLSDGQWGILEGSGLRMQDLTPEQKALPFLSSPGPPGMEIPKPERITLERPEQEQGEGDGRTRGGRRGRGGMTNPFELRADSTYTLRITYPEREGQREGRGGGRMGRGPGNPGLPLPKTISVSLGRPKPLTEEELATPAVETAADGDQEQPED